MINNEIIYSYLFCPYKSYLKKSGKLGEKKLYNEYYEKDKNRIKSELIKDKYSNPANNFKDVELNDRVLNNNFNIINGKFQQGEFELVIDIIEKNINVDNLITILPIHIYEKEYVSRRQKLYLTILTLILKKLLNVEIRKAKIIYGSTKKRINIKLDSYIKEASEICKKLVEINNGNVTPILTRNKHCQICEFDNYCKKCALEKDDLSLFSGISSKEIIKWNTKGIFTINQLSYNFRPRRKRKQNIEYRKRNIFELKALAIRENKIFVYELPKDFKNTHTEIFWDIEGIPEIKSYYLIGALVLVNEEIKKYHLWAETKDDEKDIFLQFLHIIEKIENYSIYCYGNYEIQYLKYMKQKIDSLKYKNLIDKLIERTINLLEYFSYNIYIPVYSNSLKEIGNYFGLKWSDTKIIGINSIVVRKEWENTKDQILKNKLIQYNYEDCINLYYAKQIIQKIAKHNVKKPDFNFDVEYEEVYEKNTRFGILEKNYANTSFEYIINCSYFDYQYDRVCIRNKEGKRIRNQKRNASSNPNPKKTTGRINQKIKIEKRKCIYCSNKDIGIISNEKSKRVIDIKFNHSGVKKWLTKYISHEYYCSNCMNSFIPKEYALLKEHYGHSLKSWVIYKNFVNILSFREITKNMALLFNIHLTLASAHAFKKYFNNYYSETYQNLLVKILKSPVVYVDETPFKLLSGDVYAWIFTNGKEVVSLFKKSRKGDFLKEIFKNFKGVLVSDFLPTYNSLKCKQQKCLIHLIRDFNDDLLRNPYDFGLKKITQKFTSLLKIIVKTIDKKGLNRIYLLKYKNDVSSFFDFVKNSDFKSKIANKYQERLIKNRDKLFTFIEFDNVSWNNTFAEHAIKLMAVHRNKNIKFFKESRMEDYLLIMSLYQTCEYKGINFLNFLLSKETDIDVYCGEK